MIFQTIYYSELTALSSTFTWKWEVVLDINTKATSIEVTEFHCFRILMKPLVEHTKKIFIRGFRAQKQLKITLYSL